MVRARDRALGLLVAASDALHRGLAVIADQAVWLLVALTGVICVDVVSRKLGIQIPGLGSTTLQELEWHLHAVLFSLWLGFAYLVNAHPRVDSYSEAFSLRTKAWVELLGCLVFAIPYCYVLVRWGVPFVAASFAAGESSESVGGIPYRWIIKGVFVAGLFLLLAAVLSMTLRLVAFLLGGPAVRGRITLPLETRPPSV
ncbi:MAG: TRAP transporter small permease subunit [Candidatus Rokuibacteriota bacterium]